MKITKSKPGLWSHLKIHLPNKGVSHLELVELYLKRSAPAFLTLAIDDKHDCVFFSEIYISSSSFRDHCWADERQNPDSIFWRIFRALLVRNRRWQDVSFYLLCDVLDQVFDKVGLKFADPGRALANMKSLQLSLYRSSASSDSFSGPFLRWLEEAPMLDIVELNYPYRSFSIPLFLQKHVSFSFRSLIADPAHIFHASSILESLDLDVSEAYSSAESYPRVITSKKLRCLKVNLGYWHTASAIVSAITLPFLEDLSLIRNCPPLSSEGRQKWQSSLASLIRSSCHLQKLTLIGNVVGSGPALIDLLKGTPMLTHLIIQTDDRAKPWKDRLLMDATFYRLALNDTKNNPTSKQIDSVVLPRLKHLDITLTADRNSFPYFIDISLFVRSRRQHRLTKAYRASPLEYFGMTVLTSFDARSLAVERWMYQVESKLRELENDGFRLHLWIDEVLDVD